MCLPTPSPTPFWAPPRWAISACISPIPIPAGKAQALLSSWPPPDPGPRGQRAGSVMFRAHARALAPARGYRIVNVDSTVILERPKLKDYRDAIRRQVAATLELDADRVSVKFKTAEKVGPVGEGRSAEAQAIVTVRLD